MNLHGLKKHKKEIIYAIECVENKIKGLKLKIDSLASQVYELRKRHKFLIIRKNAFNNKIGRMVRGKDDKKPKKHK